MRATGIVFHVGHLECIHRRKQVLRVGLGCLDPFGLASGQLVSLSPMDELVETLSVLGNIGGVLEDDVLRFFRNTPCGL